jgi:predicted oxidoreductase
MPELLKVLDEVAREPGTERGVIALPWKLRHPANVVWALQNSERIRTVAAATEIELDRPGWYRVLLAARGPDLP